MDLVSWGDCVIPLGNKRWVISTLITSLTQQLTIAWLKKNGTRSVFLCWWKCLTCEFSLQLRNKFTLVITVLWCSQQLGKSQLMYFPKQFKPRKWYLVFAQYCGNKHAQLYVRRELVQGKLWTSCGITGSCLEQTQNTEVDSCWIEIVERSRHLLCLETVGIKFGCKIMEMSFSDESCFSDAVHFKIYRNFWKFRPGVDLCTVLLASEMRLLQSFSKANVNVRMEYRSQLVTPRSRSLVVGYT